MSTRYKVENMKCNGCVSTVKDALGQLPGSNNVSVDLESGVAEVDGDVDLAEVVKALTALGYPASKLD